MNVVQEIFLRAAVCGVILAVVSYGVGTAHYAGKRLSTNWVRAMGGAMGIAGGLALVAGAAPWSVVVLVALFAGGVGATLLSAALALQDRFAGTRTKRESQ